MDSRELIPASPFLHCTPSPPLTSDAVNSPWPADFSRQVAEAVDLVLCRQAVLLRVMIDAAYLLTVLLESAWELHTRSRRSAAR